MKKKVALIDIAQALGVSRTLVSMVLNGQGDQHGISPITQEKVKAKAKELNYKPNSIARGLRTGKSNTIGLIVTDISNSFYATIARRIEENLRKLGYHLIFCSSDERPEREEELIQMLRGRQVDGLILATTFQESTVLEEMQKEEYPFVLIDREVPQLNTHAIVVDNYNSSKRAIEHLLASNHQEIGLLTISPAHLSTIKDREQGYKDALVAANIPIQTANICEIAFDDIEHQVALSLKKMLHKTNPITAIYAINNRIGKACLEHLNQVGIKVPEDIALLCYDDIDVFKFCGVTAVAQPIEKMGDEAVRVLLQQINSSTTTSLKPQKVILPASLVLRKSCKSFSASS
ncbi:MULTISPECIES: LacI family DNA-binding transcriptional regulator [unclassified Aureispira]|uniref:LacI family DNA-binding transcriptional regulator n=1 Tax=unclassified Aureispira TaxID=2649989 RepID=UPI0006977DE4|nr:MULTISPECIES: LacI family DNA-binding transcriptional regulator [unclassified Aureispira]WMX15643.1 LacI family DNA-binding transcriptional regulator [Aureispira sp. CCB-E]